MIKINGVILFRSSGQPTDAVHAIATMAYMVLRELSA